MARQRGSLERRAEVERNLGRLWVVATPIGNLGDLSPRAREVLASVALVAAEDTRHSALLLARAGCRARLMSLHEHNERERVEQLLDQLRAGLDVALISDAGTPLVSDPGFQLVRAARAAGCMVSPVPGPCAAIAALSVAGLPSDRFCFEGFLPAAATARRERLRALAAEPRTLIFHESSHRIGDAVEDAIAVFGSARPAVLARELTKRFESVFGNTLGEIAQRLEGDADQRRGEFVLLIGGAQGDEADVVLAEGRRAYRLLCEELPPARAARLAAAISGAPRRLLYAGDRSGSAAGD